MDREQYEKELKERQEKHLILVNQNRKPCMHDQCQNCHGTGIKIDGSPCVHFISCNCPKCTVIF